MGKSFSLGGNEARAKEIVNLLDWRICRAVKAVPLADGVISPPLLPSVHPPTTQGLFHSLTLQAGLFISVARVGFRGQGSKPVAV